MANSKLFLNISKSTNWHLWGSLSSIKTTRSFFWWRDHSHHESLVHLIIFQFILCPSDHDSDSLSWRTIKSPRTKAFLYKEHKLQVMMMWSQSIHSTRVTNLPERGYFGDPLNHDAEKFFDRSTTLFQFLSLQLVIGLWRNRYKKLNQRKLTF